MDKRPLSMALDGAKLHRRNLAATEWQTGGGRPKISRQKLHRISSRILTTLLILQYTYKDDNSLNPEFNKNTLNSIFPTSS